MIGTLATAHFTPLDLQVALLRAELALERSVAGKRARRAFAAGLATATVLAGVAGMGIGYAMGVRAKVTPPTTKRPETREEAER